MARKAGKAMQVKYGAKLVELAKGKSSIEIGSIDKLIPTIELLKKAVLDGELDERIKGATRENRINEGKDGS